MPLAYESKAERLTFSYGLEGLPAREELLLKSIIRLLDYRLKHGWVYEPNQPNLWIVDAEKNISGINGLPGC